MSFAAVRSGGTTATSTSDVDHGAADVAGSATDVLSAVHRIAQATPDRVVIRYHYRSMSYRDLAAAIDMMVPVTRAQHMDDRAAVVAAIFAGMPALSSERNPATVASVVDGTFARVLRDRSDLDTAAPSPAPGRALRTSEIDLRGIASRLSGA